MTDFPDKIRSTRADGKLIDAPAIDGELAKTQLDGGVRNTLDRADVLRQEIPQPTTRNAGKPLVGNADGDGYEARDLPYSGDAEAVEKQISSLQNRTSDLHAPPPATGWTDALVDGSEGGIALRTGNWNLAQARAASYAVSLDSGLDGRIAVRVRAGVDPRQARVDIQGAPGQSYYDLLTNFQYLGASVDEVWDYYWDPDTLGDVTLLLLQLTSSAVHIGQSVFRGEFDGRFSERIQSELSRGGVAYIRSRENVNRGVRVHSGQADHAWKLLTKSLPSYTPSTVTLAGRNAANRLRLTLPPAFAGHGIDPNIYDLAVVRGNPATSRAAQNASVRIQASGQGAGIEIGVDSAGEPGNAFRIDVQTVERDTPPALTYTSGFSATLTTSLNYTVDNLVAAINRARHNGNQLITARRWNSSGNEAIGWLRHGNYAFSGGSAATTSAREPLSFGYDPATNTFSLTVIAADPLASIAAVIEAWDHNGERPFAGHVTLTGNENDILPTNAIGATVGAAVRTDFAGGTVEHVTVTLDDVTKEIEVAFADFHTLNHLVSASTALVTLSLIPGTDGTQLPEEPETTVPFDFDSREDREDTLDLAETELSEALHLAGAEFGFWNRRIKGFRYRDFNGNNELRRLPYRNDSFVLQANVYITGLAWHPITGQAYIVAAARTTPGALSGLFRFDSDTGVAERVGAGWGNLTPESFTIANDGSAAYLSSIASNNTIHELNLETGAIGRLVLDRSYTDTDWISGLAASSERLWAVAQGGQLFEIDLADDSVSELTANAGAPIYRLAWSGVWNVLLGLGTDGHLYRWNATDARFDRLNSSPAVNVPATDNFFHPGIQSYAMAFSRRRNAFGALVQRVVNP